jgi:hypothetical protein
MPWIRDSAHGRSVGLTCTMMLAARITGDQIVGGEGISEFLQGLRIGTLQESVRALLRADAMLPHAQGQPVMLIEIDASGEGKIG